MNVNRVRCLKWGRKWDDMKGEERSIDEGTISWQQMIRCSFVTEKASIAPPRQHTASSSSRFALNQSTKKNNANLMSGIERNWAKKKLCATIYKYRLRRTLVIKTGNKTPPPPPPSSSAPKECTVLSGVICNVHTLTDVAWCSYTRDRLDDVMALVHRSLQTHKNIALFYFTSLHLLHCLSHFLQRHFRVPCQ